jgi:hypothetical protein
MPSENSTERVNKGLLALYKFNEGDGFVVNDQSGTDEPLDLFIDNPNNVDWEIAGGITIHENTIIRSENSANKVINACKSSNEITLEAWILPAEVEQLVPARILTISKDNYSRGATLDQFQESGAKQNKFLYSTSLTAKDTVYSPMPKISMQTGIENTGIYHLVYTRDDEGHEQFYLNGELIEVGFSPYDFSEWSDNYLFAIGNEITQNRPWFGTIYLASIYNLALNAEQVEKNYLAGYGSSKITTEVLTSKEPLAVDVYPNPVRNLVNINVKNTTIEDCDIQLFDISGRLIKTNHISRDDVFGEIRTIDMSVLKQGIYVIQISDLSSNMVKTVKVIKY